MKHRIICLALLLFIIQNTFALPAKRIWRTVSQPDGTTIDIAIGGDERFHCYTTRDNVPVVGSDAKGWCYAITRADGLVSSHVLAHEAATRPNSDKAAVQKAIAASPRLISNAHKSGISLARVKKAAPKSHRVMTGEHRAPVILAYFSDKRFDGDSATINDFYTRMLNEPGYSQNNAGGSVADYFSDMSRGQFKLTFDVIGPVRVSKSATYYGGPSYYFGGTDHVGEFITEAIEAADSLYDIDWTKYDWNNDGEVEQVFVAYAGYGQATGGETGTIWPCAWTLDEAGQYSDGHGGFSLDNIYINRFACSNELYGSTGTKKMGMGVFCHEFSHCLGLPDVYDTNYGSTPTMGKWDLMAHGSYNGPEGIGWCPAPWTSYERRFAGWLEPVEPQPGDTIRGVRSLCNDGTPYIIYNDGHKDEYFLLENHDGKGWDAYTPEKGLLVIHVDYDSVLFANNIVNSTGSFTRDKGYDGDFTNDHARMYPLSKIRSVNNETYYYTFPMEGKRFTLDSLTDNSSPGTTLYNANLDGTKNLGKPIYDIATDSLGYSSFVYMPQAIEPEPTAIANIRRGDSQSINGIWTIDGRFVGSQPARLPKGIYIVRYADGRAKTIYR